MAARWVEFSLLFSSFRVFFTKEKWNSVIEKTTKARVFYKNFYTADERGEGKEFTHLVCWDDDETFLVANNSSSVVNSE